MLSNLTIGKKLAGTTAAMFILASVLGYSGLQNATTFNDQFHNTVDILVRKVVLAAKIDLARETMVSSQRGIVLAAFSKDLPGLEAYEQEFQQQAEIIRKSTEEIRPLLVREEAKPLVEEILASVSEWRPHHEKLLGLAKEGHALEADHIRTEMTAPIYKKIGTAAIRLQSIQAEQLTEVKARVEGHNAFSRQLALGFLVLFLVVAFFVMMIVKGITRDVRGAVLHLGDCADQVAGAAVQVSSASQSLAHGASEQATSLEDTSSSSDEISSMTRKNAENSKMAAELTGHVNQRVAVTNQSLEQMVASMLEINTSSDKVSKIIKVIDEIAFQTNILALNAAVEAARAGEAGMGFAVVADEVRNLAQRCAQAAKDTASLIEESITKSRDGMNKLDHVAEAIRSITESSTEVKALVDDVHLGSEEQARGIEQIAKAISEMEQVTQKNAANAEQSASASEELSAQAQTMRGVVVELQALVGGGGQKPPQASQTLSKAGAAHVPTRPRSESMSRDFAALKTAVSQKTIRRQSLTPPVPVGQIDRSELPLDEDFKEF